MWRVHSKVDGDGRNALVLPGESVSLGFNLLPHIIKVCVLPSLLMKKLCKLYRRRLWELLGTP